MSNRLYTKSYAKINLFFEVLYKREDNFHEVRTVMQTISLYDDLYLEFADKDEFILESPFEGIPIDDRNIVIKALKKFREVSKINNAYKITLKKRIPTEAGLSGGSSNAANILLLLNQIEDSPLSFSQLEEISADLGSDVNFHLYRGLAICTSRGEIVKYLPPINFNANLYVIKPKSNSSTGSAYSELKKVLHLPKKNVKFRYFEDLTYRLKSDSLVFNIHNDFESVVLTDESEILSLKKRIEELSVDKVWMTGSGSSLIIISSNDIETILKEMFPNEFVGRFEMINN